MSDPAPSDTPVRQRLLSRSAVAWAVVVTIVLLTAAVRWRLLDVPLERDEGEYAYAGQLMLQGIPPYEQVYNMKLPGIYAAYAAVLAVFGESHRGIRLGLLVINAATILLVFLLARRLFDPFTGVVAAGVFATLALGVYVQGIFANAEQFVLLPAVGGLLLVVRWSDTGRSSSLVAGGLLLGCALLVKQHAVAFVAMAAAWAWIASSGPQRLDRGRRAARVGLVLGTALAPYLVTCLLLWSAGVFERFWFWTVRYALVYGRRLPPGETLSELWEKAGPLAGAAPVLWLMAAGGLIVLPWTEGSRGRRPFVVLFAAASLLAVLPGLQFRPHYFLLVLPAAALLVGVFARFLGRRATWLGREAIRFGAPAVLVLLASGHSLYAQRAPLFDMTPFELSRHVYWPNPFPESLELAEFVRANTDEEDRVALFGSEPQIFFYADRRSATGYIYAYALMENQPYALQMQEEMILEVTASDPELIIFVHVHYSWLRTPDSHTRLFEWLQEYIEDYRLVAAVEILPEGSRSYRGDELARFDRDSENNVAIFKRQR